MVSVCKETGDIIFGDRTTSLTKKLAVEEVRHV
jgi:hypothetical protein